MQHVSEAERYEETSSCSISIKFNFTL